MNEGEGGKNMSEDRTQVIIRELLQLLENEKLTKLEARIILRKTEEIMFADINEILAITPVTVPNAIETEIAIATHLFRALEKQHDGDGVVEAVAPSVVTAGRFPICAAGCEEGEDTEPVSVDTAAGATAPGSVNFYLSRL